MVLHSCKLPRRVLTTGITMFIKHFKYRYVPALSVGSTVAGVLANGGALAAAASLSFAALMPTRY